MYAPAGHVRSSRVCSTAERFEPTLCEGDTPGVLRQLKLHTELGRALLSRAARALEAKRARQREQQRWKLNRWDEIGRVWVEVGPRDHEELDVSCGDQVGFGVVEGCKILQDDRDDEVEKDKRACSRQPIRRRGKLSTGGRKGKGRDRDR